MGVTSHPVHTGGAKLALYLQIACLKLKVHSKDTPQLDFHQALHRLSTQCPLWISKIEKGGHQSYHPYRWRQVGKQCNSQTEVTKEHAVFKHLVAMDC